MAPHVEPLYRLAFRFCGNQHEAEDLVQDLLTKLFPRHNELVKIENLRTWLARTMRNHYIDSYRRKVRSPVSFGLEDDYESEASRESGPAHQLATTQLQQELISAVEQLNEDQRVLVTMHDMEAYTLSELADILDTPIGTLKSRLHRARARLRNILGDGTFSIDEAC